MKEIEPRKCSLTRYGTRYEKKNNIQSRNVHDIIGDWEFQTDDGNTCIVHIKEIQQYEADLYKISCLEKQIVALLSMLDQHKYENDNKKSIRRSIIEARKKIMDIHKRYIHPEKEQ